MVLADVRELKDGIEIERFRPLNGRRNLSPHRVN